MFLAVLIASVCIFEVNSQCSDNNRSCSYWARIGQCRSNARYMLVYCKKSCNQCRIRPAAVVLSSPSRGQVCSDKNRYCGDWARKGECRRNRRYMLVNCKKSCGKCSVNGGFSSWGSWERCSKNCGGGVQYRSRSCNNPRPSNGGRGCQGNSREKRNCNTKGCPVDGGYSSWGSYGPCDNSCGGGVKYRQRSCNNPAPANGGKNCKGAARESSTCNTQKCPVDGGYSSWGSYGACDKSCGGGVKYRERSCNSPAPAYGEKNCIGASRESSSCNTQSCPVDGEYSSWGPWSPCSKSCGFGIKFRSRSCDNPAPSGGGRPCIGRSRKSSPCKVKECIVDGEYSSWGPWSPCSKTCGFGIKFRSRSCDNPAPSVGGRPCIGRSRKSFPCKVKECIVLAPLPLIRKPGKCAVITDSMKGNCPPPEIMNLDECTWDGLCDGAKKCCSDGCFLKCVDPL